MAKRSYLFIDGECFRHIIDYNSDRYFDGQRPEIMWSALNNWQEKVFYYDAIPVRQHGEELAAYEQRISPKVEQLNFISRQPRFHVKTGDARHRRRRGNEQKKVDVQLAVDAMYAASRRVLDSITIITGDADFVPLVQSLVEMGVDVKLIYPIGATSEELIQECDYSQPCDIDLFASWLYPKFIERFSLPTLTHLSELSGASVKENFLFSDANGKGWVLRFIEGGRWVFQSTFKNEFGYYVEVSSPNIGLIPFYVYDKIGLTVPDDFPKGP